ncbi:hypothetical protein F66182_7929 [Fusarium sp. NRRL 66182]|nr:hypothetical protein F66182_7929 [Fusarium sp. NRRL 66182]
MSPPPKDKSSPAGELGEGGANMSQGPNFENNHGQELAAPSSMSATGTSSHIEPDVFDRGRSQDESYFESSNTSYLTSIASDIRRGVQENGRTFAAYGLHKAWIPSDDLELDRNDLQHCKFTMLMGNRLHLAPIPDYPHKILDLGTGSGIWAIDMAEQHPSATVIGVDTTPVQPSAVPPNLVFEIDDVEDDWLWAEGTFDLIHGRELMMAIHDWPRLVNQAFAHLKPGAYLQLSGSVPDIKSDDGTLPPNSAFAHIGKLYFDMSERVGCSGWEPTRWRRHLENAGFEDIVERVLKVPMNPWPKDKRLKEIGAFELSHFRDTVSSVFSRGYEQILGGDPVDLQVLLAKAQREVLNPNMHSWLPLSLSHEKLNHLAGCGGGEEFNDDVKLQAECLDVIEYAQKHKKQLDELIFIREQSSLDKTTWSIEHPEYGPGEVCDEHDVEGWENI